jgi:putative hydrolase of the HAD superfamily
MIRAVLFDLFDTLLYMEPTSAWQEGIRLAGEAGLTKEQWLAGWRSTADRAMRGQIRLVDERVRQALIVAGLPDPPDRLVQSMGAARRRDWLDSAALYGDVPHSLAELRRTSYKLGLVSNIFAYEMDIIQRLGLRPLLDAVVLSCDIGTCKPDPGIYLAAAVQLAVAPAECVFVGDGMSGELSGARAVGMTAVRIDRSVRDEGEERGDAYDARVTTLPELLEWLTTTGERTEHA